MAQPLKVSDLSSLWWYQKSRQFLGKKKTKRNRSRNSWRSFQIHLCWCLGVKRLMETLMVVEREILTYVSYSIWDTLVVFNVYLLLM